MSLTAMISVVRTAEGTSREGSPHAREGHAGDRRRKTAGEPFAAVLAQALRR